MENASKALIIAGSIIISLVIVSLGILVYRRVSGTVTNANLDQQQIEAHNSEYEAYFGDYVSAANTKALLAKIKTNNTQYVANANSTDELVPIFIIFHAKDSSKVKGISQDTVTKEIGKVISNIQSSKHYKIYVSGEGISADAGTVTNGTLTAPTNNVAYSATAESTTAGYYQNGYIRLITIEEV